MMEQTFPEPKNDPIKPENPGENFKISDQEKNIQEVFKLNPELEKIGTKEQYGEYLKTIFPESVVNSKIFQHQTKKEFNSFSNEKYSSGRLGEGHYFSDFGNDYIKNDSALMKKAVVLDIKNPKHFTKGDFMIKVYSMMDERNLNSDDEELRYKIIKEYTEELKKDHDALIADKNGNLNSETLVFDSSQTYVLGSHEDMQKFKEFVKQKNPS